MIERLTQEQGYNFAEAIHNRLEALRQAGIIGVSHERLDSLHGMYLVEMYILKPLPGEFLPEQYRLSPQPAGLPAPKVQD